MQFARSRWALASTSQKISVSFGAFSALIALLFVATGEFQSTARADTRRFEVAVAGAGTGPGHSFVVGDGLYLVFRDRAAPRTRYRVCWGPRGRRFTRCWDRISGNRGTYSKIFTPAPNYVAYWTAKWFSYGRAVGTWTFYNGQGD